MSKLPKKHFWDWFKRHNAEYLSLKDKSNKEAQFWINELNAHLRAYYKFFHFGLQWGKGQPTILTISVHGKAMHFKKADDLVSKAPEIPGWKIVSLDQPRPMGLLLEEVIMEAGIDPHEFSFSLDGHSPNPTVTVYHPLYTTENDHLFYRLAHGAVYNLLGERSFGNDIGEIEVTNLSFAETDEIAELEALPEKIGLQNSGVVVDEEGNLVSIF
jgi:hypothetical protein